MSDEQLEKNKALVTRFFKELVLGPESNLDVIDEIVDENYIQHNPMAGQGAQGLREFFINVFPKISRKPPILGTTLIAEGDLVVQQLQRSDGMLVDIFRVKDGKLVEHWDAFRPAVGSERIPGF